VSETCELCTSCPHRDYCSSLCPEAELYVKQDEAPQNELTIGVPTYGRWPDSKEKALFTKREKEVLSRLIDGKSREEIVQELDITLENLRDIIRRIRRKREKIIPKIDG